MYNVWKHRQKKAESEHKDAMQKKRVGFVGEKRVPDREARNTRASMSMERFNDWVVNASELQQDGLGFREPLVHEHTFRDRDPDAESMVHSKEFGVHYETEKDRCKRLAKQHEGEMLQREAWYRLQHHNRAPPDDLIHTPVRARLRTREFTDAERLGDVIPNVGVTGSQDGPWKEFNPSLYTFRPQESLGANGKPKHLKGLGHAVPCDVASPGPGSFFQKPEMPVAIQDPWVEMGRYAVLHKELPVCHSARSARAEWRAERERGTVVGKDMAQSKEAGLQEAGGKPDRRFDLSLPSPRPKVIQKRDKTQHSPGKYRKTLANIACKVPHDSTNFFENDVEKQFWAKRMTGTPRRLTSGVSPSAQQNCALTEF